MKHFFFHPAISRNVLAAIMSSVHQHKVRPMRDRS